MKLKMKLRYSRDRSKRELPRAESTELLAKANGSGYPPLAAGTSTPLIRSSFAKRSTSKGQKTILQAKLEEDLSRPSI